MNKEIESTLLDCCGEYDNLTLVFSKAWGNAIVEETLQAQFADGPVEAVREWQEDGVTVTITTNDDEGMVGKLLNDMAERVNYGHKQARTIAAYVEERWPVYAALCNFLMEAR